MASIYKKGKKIYISWYDPFSGKPLNKSLGLDYNSENFKNSKKFAKQFQNELDKQKDQFNKLKIVKDNIGNAMDHFYRNNSNKHPKTIEEYKWFFEKFNKNFPSTESCTKISKLSCEEWLTSLRNSKYQQNTLYKLSKVLKKFLRFLFEYQYIPMFLLNKDVTFKMDVKPIIIFNDSDLKIMIKALENKNSNFKTTFYLLLFTGLRPSDIYELDVKNIDLNKKIISYYSPKTQEYFKVPIHAQLVPILQIRIDEVGEGKLLNYATIANIGTAFRRFLSDNKLSKNGYTLRTFRKNFISMAHGSGMDLATVSKLAGHKKITTTEKYYNKLSLEKQSKELLKLTFPFEI